MFNTSVDNHLYLEKNRLRALLLNNNSTIKKTINQKKIFERNSPLDSYYTFNKHISNSNFSSITKSSYEDYLMKKLNNCRKENRQLNTQIKNITVKSNNLLKDISNNKMQYLKITQEYEKEIEINKELESKLKKNMINYEEEKELNEIKEEQNILLMTLKSKDKIINNLKITLNLITKDNSENKKINESIINEKDNQIKELKNILEQLSNKFDENKKLIESKKEEKEKLKNHNISYNDKTQENLGDTNNINIKRKKNELHIQIEEDKFHNINKVNKNYYNNQPLLTITEKADNNSNDSDNYNFTLSSINIHRRIKSNEINNDYNIENIEFQKSCYSEGNIIKDINKNNEIKKNSFYLYSITKYGELLEFDLIEKNYKTIKKNEIKDWNSFINEYISFSDGSSFLNSFQGLFILTGKYHKDLYYFSKKYNSISKINEFNYGHKYGSLILEPNSENIIALGGETKQVEILNIETGQIQILPNLLTERINSTYTFIDNKLFAFFGKNNNQIEYLDIKNKKQWELFNLKKNVNNLRNKEGLAAININDNEILFTGNMNNNRMIKFNYNKQILEYENIYILSNNKTNKYIFDKDKYFNNFVNFDMVGKDGNYLNQFVGIDSIGNIHYLNNDLTYTIINNEYL